MAKPAPTPAKPSSDADNKHNANTSLIWQLLLAGVIFGIIAPITVWMMMQDPGPSPSMRLNKAVEALNEKNNIEAHRQILLVKEANYTEPNYGGTIEYVIGILCFRDAMMMDGSAAQRMYKMAITYLKTAEKKSLTAIYLPEWSYALGTSYYRIGKIRAAIPLLKMAWESFPEEKARIGLYLAECEMNPNVEVPLDELKPGINQIDYKFLMALSKNELANQAKDFKIEEQVDAQDQRIRLLINLKRIREADQAFQDLQMYLLKVKARNPDKTFPELSLRVLEARILKQQQQYQKAIDILTPHLLDGSKFNSAPLRQAYFYLGEIYEEMGNIDQALQSYRSAAISDESDEFIPASLRVASLLRRTKDQHEQAYELYLRVLKQTLVQEDFNNIYISWQDIRDEMRSAWQNWIETRNFRWAIDLSERLSPLFTPDDAHEMGAIVAMRWAENTQLVYDQAVFSQREQLYPKVVERWKIAGIAFSRLAYTRRTLASYPDALWSATRMYRKGNEFEKALKTIDEFLKTQPTNLLPTALVLRGEILLDLHGTPPHDTIQEAISVFQRVIDDHPRDSASFRAMVDLGRAYLESSESDMALEIWDKILTKMDLAPDAMEWRNSLFLFAQTSMNYADQNQYFSRQQAATNPDEANRLTTRGYQQIAASIRALREYILRVKTGPSHIEAKWMLAQCLHKKSREPELKLPNAETDNVREELRQEINISLREVLTIFEELRVNLQPLAAINQLNLQDQNILMDAYFETGHVYYELAQYQDQRDLYMQAISAYRDAVNYYPRNPQVLLAYYQMANCYQRLDQNRQARSYLEQARILLQTIPPDQFTLKNTNFSRDEWQRLLEQTLQLHENSTTAKNP
jgi:tetratricopeptide (TPR) repeat protein